MSSLAIALGLAALFAVVDWWSVATDTAAVERVFKPATMLALIAVPVVAADAPSDVRAYLIVGGCLGLVGDIALLREGETSFMVGLGAFALGHLLYAAAATARSFTVAWGLVGAVAMVALLAYRFLAETLPGARRHGGTLLWRAVIFYAFVITMMVIAAWGTGLWIAGVGAALFAISDWALGYQRFVAPLPGGRVSVHVPYHVGQALLITALVAG